MKNPKSYSKATPGAGYMKGRHPNYKDPSCPSSGYVYGHSQAGGKSPSTVVKTQKS